MNSDFRLLEHSRSVVACLLVIALLFAGFFGDLGILRDLWRYFGLILVIAVIVWRDQLLDLSPARKAVVLGALAGFVVGAGLQAVYSAWWNHMNMREYDFFALYIDGFIAWRQLDFYEPANYQTAYELIQPPFAELHGGFKRNVLEVGTKYPPPTLLYLAPFGALERLDAHVVWVGVSWVAMITVALLFWFELGRLEPQHRFSLTTLLAFGALILLFPGTKLTLSLEQMHFSALVLLVLAYIYRSRAVAGALVALGTIIKPPVGAAALYLLWRRNFPAIVCGMVATIVLCGASILVFGWDVFTRFFTDNPNLRVSNSLYYEDMNRSMLGTAIRNFGWDFSKGSPMGHPVFLIGAAVVTLITAVCVLIDRGRSDPRLFALLAMFALLIYPGTQRHYAVLLLLPLMLFVFAAEDAGWSRALVFVITIALAGFSVFATFWVCVALWLALIAVIVTDRHGST